MVIVGGKNTGNSSRSIRSENIVPFLKMLCCTAGAAALLSDKISIMKLRFCGLSEYLQRSFD